LCKTNLSLEVVMIKHNINFFTKTRFIYSWNYENNDVM